VTVTKVQSTEGDEVGVVLYISLLICELHTSRERVLVVSLYSMVKYVQYSSLKGKGRRGTDEKMWRALTKNINVLNVTRRKEAVNSCLTLSF
jgi:hypothetical protein